MTDEQQESKEQLPAVTWSEFLESYPLNTVQLVSQYWGTEQGRYRFAPILRLYCSQCEGIRNFTGSWRLYGTVAHLDWVNDFLEYTCKDCGEAHKTFCVRSTPTENIGIAYAVKLGEFPEAHVELPRSLKTLLGNDYQTL